MWYNKLYVLDLEIIQCYYVLCDSCVQMDPKRKCSFITQLPFGALPVAKRISVNHVRVQTDKENENVSRRIE